ncbi:MAG: DUF1573 domain-containing protein [Bacteroidales bacterium]
MQTLRDLILMAAITAVMFSCSTGRSDSASQPVSQEGIAQQWPVISFEKEVHDFGKIIAGERVAYGFRFTNEGNSPLVITGIRSGCGCTVGDYPKDPLMPGEGGRINVVFNSAGRKGFQSESVRVLANTQESVITLRITAEVLER